MMDPRLIAEWAGKKWAFPTRLVVPSAATTVLTTPTSLLLGNPNRVAWMLINMAVNRGFFWFNSSITTTFGIPIEAGGDTWSADIDEDGELVYHPLFAALQTASGNMIVIEVLRDRGPKKEGV